MTVQFSSLNEIKEFVGLASLQPYGIYLHTDGGVVNAKCFMQMCTVDFTNPLELAVSGTENEKRFLKMAKKFIV